MNTQTADPLGILDENEGTQVKLAVNRAVSQAELFRVSSDKEYEGAGEFLKAIKSVMKEVDAYFDPAIKQAHQAHKAVKATKDKQYDPLLKAQNLIKIKMGEFHRKRVEEARVEEEKRLKALAEETPFEGEDEPPTDIAFPKPLPKVKGVKHTTTFQWKIVDRKAVNERFLTPDVKAIGALVKSSGKKAEEIVGGIQVWQTTGTSVTV